MRDKLELVKELHENIDVKYHGLQVLLLIITTIAKETSTSIVEGKDDSQLIDTLPHNHLPHCCG
jgi:hypothetical protein